MLVEIKNLNEENISGLPIKVKSFGIKSSERFQLADPAGQIKNILKKDQSYFREPEKTIWLEEKPELFFQANLPLKKQVPPEIFKIAEGIICFSPVLFHQKPRTIPTAFLSILCWLTAIFSNPSLIIAQDDLTSLGPYARQRFYNKITGLLTDNDISLIQLTEVNLPANPLIQHYFMVRKGEIIEVPEPETTPPSNLQSPFPDYKILSLQNYSGEKIKDWNINIAQNQSWTFVCDNQENALSLGRTLAGLKTPEKGTRSCILKPREIFFYESSPFLKQKTLRSNLKFFTKHLVNKNKSREILPGLKERIREYNFLYPENILSFFPDEITPSQELNLFLLWISIIKPRLLILNNPPGLIPENINLIKSIIENQRTNILFTTTRSDLALTQNLGIVFGERLIETGPQKLIREKPFHPYTRNIFYSISKVPSPFKNKTAINGCSFHSACSYALHYCGWEGEDLENMLKGCEFQSSIHRWKVINRHLTIELAYTAELTWQDLIEKIKELIASLNQPLASACSGVEYENRRVWVYFPEKKPPTLVEAEPQRWVACNLFK